MAITTLDAALAGMQPPAFFSKVGPGSNVAGVPCSYWGASGFPAAGGFNATLNGGVYSSSSGLVAGQLPHYDPSAGLDAYLARLTIAPSAAGIFLLCDRLWDNGGISATSTAVQNITSPAWPARDANGATSGASVLLGLEVSAQTGAGTPTVTVGYTNSAGTAGQSATNFDATVASSPIGRFYRMALAAGDLGVQSVQSIQLSSTWTSGTINLVAYRILASIECQLSYASPTLDPLTSGMPRIYNGAVPFAMFIPNAAGVVSLTGTYVETQG